MAQEFAGFNSPKGVKGTLQASLYYNRKDRRARAAVPTSFLPSNLSGLVLWADGSDTSTYTHTDNRLSVWADKSGQGNDLSAGAAGPLVNNRTLNGKPAVHFDDTDAMNTGALLVDLDASDFTIVTVSVTEVYNSDVLWSFDNLYKIFIHGSAQFRLNAGGGSVTDNQIGGAGGASNPSMLTMAGGGLDGEANTYLDGVLDNANVGATFPAGGSDFIIGAQSIGSSGTRFTGLIAEVIVYDRKLTDDELGDVHTYLAAKWGIAGNYATDIQVSGAGQSNMARKFLDSQQGQIAIEGELENFWSTSTITNGATSGSAVCEANGTASNHWLNSDFLTFGAAMDTWKASVADIDIKLIIWNQGEADGPDLLTVGTAGSLDASEKEGYKTALLRVFAEMHNTLGTIIPVVIEPIGRRGTGTYVGWQYVREVQIELAKEYWWITLSAPIVELAMVDDFHRTFAAYTDEGERSGRVAAWFMGRGVTGGLFGAEISNVSRSGTAVTLTVSHEDGADFVPTTGIEGMAFEDDGVEIAITAAVRTNATTITLTLNSAPTGVEKFYNHYRTLDAVTQSNIVVDDATEALPFQATVWEDSGSGFGKVI